MQFLTHRVPGTMDMTQLVWQEILTQWSDAVTVSRINVPALTRAFSNAIHNLRPFSQIWHGNFISTKPMFSWLVAGSIVAALLVTVISFFSWLVRIASTDSKQKKQTKRSQTYIHTRIFLVRAMSVVFLAAFTTSAFQGRAMYGVEGIQVRSCFVLVACSYWLHGNKMSYHYIEQCNE